MTSQYHEHSDLFVYLFILVNMKFWMLQTIQGKINKFILFIYLLSDLTYIIYISREKFRTFLFSDKILSENKNVRNFWCPNFKSVRIF